jgi:hypothetical protein
LNAATHAKKRGELARLLGHGESTPKKPGGWTYSGSAAFFVRCGLAPSTNPGAGPHAGQAKRNDARIAKLFKIVSGLNAVLTVTASNRADAGRARLG